MSSGFGVYQSLLLAFFIALLFAMGVTLISQVFRKTSDNKVPPESKAKEEAPNSNETKTNSRFFLAATIIPLYVVLLFLFLPTAVNLVENRAEGLLVLVLGGVLLLLTVTYSVKKGDLNWYK